MRRMPIVMMLLFLLVSNSFADELVFGDYDEYVSKLDFQLAMFDLQFNFLDVYRKPSHVQSIASVGFYKKIYSYVYLNDDITEVPKNKRKQTLRDICEQVFRLYRNNFMMFYEINSTPSHNPHIFSRGVFSNFLSLLVLSYLNQFSYTNMRWCFLFFHISKLQETF